MTFLALATFAQLLHECASNIGTRTMTAIVRVESGGDPNAIHDNTIGRTFRPIDAREASAWAKQLIATHHNVDLGLSQINSANLDHLGMDVDDAFDPCINLHGGATILAYDYRAAVAKFGSGQFALRRAIGAYNSGSIFEGDHYVDEILAAAGISAPADFAVPDVAPLPGGSAVFASTKTKLGPFRSPRPLPQTARRRSPLSSPIAATQPAVVQTQSGLTPFNAPLLVTSGLMTRSASATTVPAGSPVVLSISAPAVPSPASAPAPVPASPAVPALPVAATSAVRSGILVPVAANPAAVATPAPGAKS